MEDVLLKDPNKFLAFIQGFDENNASEAEKAVDTIATILKNAHKEKAWNDLNTTKRQTTLSLAFRTHKQLILKHDIQHKKQLKAEDFLAVEHEQDELKQICAFEALHAFLQTENEANFNAKLVLKVCLKVLKKCQIDQENLICIIFHTINLLVRKIPILEPDVELSQIYAYLQINQNGAREEVLMLFSNCCKSLETAQNYFNFIMEYYPWTHRNKYLLLSCILQHPHTLDILLQHSGQSAAEFFDGLRLSLAYKRLLSPSQYLVKALSRQESLGLLELAATILTTGTFREIQNFYANWFNRITQKDTLFELLFQRLDIDVILENFTTQINEIEEYRFVLIFIMYCRQIHGKSKLDFFRISTELITNCFQFQSETRLLIYKFVVDNLNYFALEDILEFLASFIVEHKSVDNAQIRNNILGKISSIINYVAKSYRKALKISNDGLSTLSDSICDFFRKLHQLIANEIESKIYQPKIYTLKLLEVLLKSLYQKKLEKNAKNCVVNENELLGQFLIAKGVFNGNETTAKLIKALNDPTGFDDALDFIVQLLKRMPSDLTASDFILSCQKCCESVDIDECNLGARYALVALDICSSAKENAMILQKYALNKLHLELVDFENDPLNTCKRRCHIFGFITIINATMNDTLIEHDDSKLAELIDLLEFIVNLILEQLLRSPSASNNYETSNAASFQDMDESLQILVENSSFPAENSEEYRKFLLMSFWLTLKACCDAATTLGIILAHHEKNEIDCVNLQRCFKINVAVLTRCRHKGAIEAAGLSIGKLTKHVTSHKTQLPLINKMLYDALSLLFLKENLVSTTRRGAGFSIMFLHIVKNDEQLEKPILTHVMQEIFQLLTHSSTTITPLKEDSNCDRMEALCLHYLCVLAKDSELRDKVAVYRNEIILAAIRKIDDTEWTICNAALQLFGALIPKIVGQKQATELEVVSADWEPAVVTFAEIASSMPETFEYIITYCEKHASESRFTRSIILFLGFLSKLEHLAQDVGSQAEGSLLYRLRELMWLLLRHREEKVRKLSALVFVRAHEFRYELPQILITASSLLFSVHDENFFQGLMFVLELGVSKIRHEALHTIESNCLTAFLQQLRSIIDENYIFKSNFKTYTQCKLLCMLCSLGFESQSPLVVSLQQFLQANAKVNNLSDNYDELFKKFELAFNEYGRVLQ